MGFKVVGGTPTIYSLWMPVDRVVGATSLYVGQLVQCLGVTHNGAAPLIVSTTLADTGKQVIFGVVTGMNNYPMTELTDATYGQYITSVQTQAEQKAIMKMGNEGMFVKGDPQPLVQIARIFPGTVLQGPIFMGTYGTAPTVLTPTAVTAAGVGMTTNSDGLTMASMAQCSTTYCRTGANAGIYRVDLDVSQTVKTFTTYWPYDLAVTDTFVRVPFKVGTCYANLNTAPIGMGFDCVADVITANYMVDVHSLDLKEAGKEKVTFTFNASHFCGRA
jgi:hypothetical protein